MWDQCLFYMRESDTSYMYLVFHVDDFIVSGTSERIIDDDHAHSSFC